MLPVGLDKCLTAGALPVTLVMPGILVMIILVIFFGRIERLRRKNRRHNRRGEASAGGKPGFGGFRFQALLFRVIEDRRAV
ncbi:hypothetical protein D3C73_1115970 [compost metagenome]